MTVSSTHFLPGRKLYPLRLPIPPLPPLEPESVDLIEKRMLELHDQISKLKRDRNNSTDSELRAYCTARIQELTS